MRRDFLNVGILWFILTFAVELILPTLHIFPLASAEEAVLSDESFYILLVLGLPVFTLVVAVMIYSAQNHWGAEAGIVYWHFVDVVWVFVYAILYLVGP